MDFYTNIPRELEDGGSERRKKIYSPTQSNVSQTERHPQTWDRNKKNGKCTELFDEFHPFTECWYDRYETPACISADVINL